MRLGNKMENNKINQEQFYDLITGEEVSWQAIIYDLIKTEQLDPWDVDISVLAEKYLQIVQELEEANFFISSKVLLACALLLKLKTDILSSNYINEIDEILYGKKEEKKYVLERIELDEDELPILVPRTPMPRFKKVTLKELMSALNKAIETEGRRIRKDIRKKQAEKATLSVMPKSTRIPLKNRIDEIMKRIKDCILELNKEELLFSELAPTREEKLANFLPMLHLDNHQKIYIKQTTHFEDIFISTKRYEDVGDLELFEEEIEDMSKAEILEGDRELSEKDVS
jgi:segregation and condensation protein A